MTWPVQRRRAALTALFGVLFVGGQVAAFLLFQVLRSQGAPGPVAVLVPPVLYFLVTTVPGRLVLRAVTRG